MLISWYQPAIMMSPPAYIPYQVTGARLYDDDEIILMLWWSLVRHG